MQYELAEQAAVFPQKYSKALNRASFHEIVEVNQTLTQWMSQLPSG